MRKIPLLFYIVSVIALSFVLRIESAVASESITVIGTADGFEDGYLFVRKQNEMVNISIPDLESSPIPEDLMKSKGRKCRVEAVRVVEDIDTGDPFERLNITKFEWLEPWSPKFRPIGEP
jgi:hypothetical protein